MDHHIDQTVLSTGFSEGIKEEPKVPEVGLQRDNEKLVLGWHCNLECCCVVYICDSIKQFTFLFAKQHAWDVCKKNACSYYDLMW